MEHKFKIGDVVLYAGFRTVFHNIPFVVLDSYIHVWGPRTLLPDMDIEYRISCQVLFGDTKRTFLQEDLQIFKPDNGQI